MHSYSLRLSRRAPVGLTLCLNVGVGRTFVLLVLELVDQVSEQSSYLPTRFVSGHYSYSTSSRTLFVHRTTGSVHEGAPKGHAHAGLRSLERTGLLLLPLGLDGSVWDAVAVESVGQLVEETRPDYVLLHEALAEALYVFDGDIAVDLTVCEAHAADAARPAGLRGDLLSHGAPSLGLTALSSRPIVGCTCIDRERVSSLGQPSTAPSQVLYTIVRGDLPPGVQVAQTAHAASEASGHPPTIVVALMVPDEASLRRVAEALGENSLTYKLITEEDGPYAGQAMAVGIAPSTDRKAIRKVTSALPLVR